MEKVIFWSLDWAKLDLDWNYQLGWSVLSFSFVKIDYEYYKIRALRILGVKVCGEQRTVGRDLTTSRPWL